MILTMRLGEQTVTAGCPSNSLVFNGKDWMRPRIGDFATLIYKQPVLAGMPLYPVNEIQVPGGFRIDSEYRCLITAIDLTSNQAQAVSAVQDPLNGACLCLVCNLGTQLLNVKVTQL